MQFLYKLLSIIVSAVMALTGLTVPSELPTAGMTTAEKIINTQNTFKNAFKNADVVSFQNITPEEEQSLKLFLTTVGDILGAFTNGINNPTAYLEDRDGFDDQELVIEFDDNDGEHIILKPCICYDSETNTIYGNGNGGMFNSGFKFDVNHLMVYAIQDCWEKDFGFCAAYDIISQLFGYDYMTRRVKFRYDNKDWMIQLWKGYYGFYLMKGGEVGVYTKPIDRPVEFYDSVGPENMMPISMKVYDKFRTYVNLELDDYWWATGFALAVPGAPKWTLTLESTLVFPNEEMADCFIDGLKKYPEISYTIENTTVNVKW